AASPGVTDQPAAGGTSVPGGTGGGTGAGVGIAPPATINLPDMYDQLSQEAGLSDLEKQLTDDYNNNTKTISDTLAMKKADIQTKIALQTQQFDINSQAAQQSLNKFQ